MESKDLNELIKNRRAIPPQFYNGEDVADELILQILENANWAPNHKQTEPWRFIVFKGSHKNELGEIVLKTVLSEFKKGHPVDPGKAEKFMKNVQKAGAVIAIILQRDKAESLPEWEEIAAVSCAVQNMWLTATSLNLAAFWSTPSFINLLGDILELNSGQKSLGFFFLGKTTIDYPSPGRGAVGDKTKWKVK